MKTKNLLWLFMLVLLIGTVSSEMVVMQYDDPFVVNVFNPVIDFVIYGQTTFSLCSCEVSASTITVKNTGNMPAFFSVKSDTEIFPSDFMLGSGESIDLSEIISVPCTQTGSSVVTFTVTAGKIQRTFRQNVNIGGCENLAVKAVQAESTILPCEAADFAVGITNTGPYTETYYLDVLNFTGTEYIAPSLQIPSHQTQFVLFTLQPDCGTYGIINPLLRITAGQSRLSADVLLDIEILPRYDSTVLFEDEYTLCSGLSKDLPLTITNHANLTNRYRIAIDGAEWMHLPATEIELGPGQAYTMNLTAAPSTPEQANLSLIVSPVYGPQEYKQHVAIEVLGCYGYEFAAEDATICTGEGEFRLSLRNSGIYAETVYLITSMQDEPVSSEYLLEPGAEAVHKIDIGDVPGTQTLTVTAGISDVGLETTRTYELTLTPDDVCYMPDIVDDRLWFRHEPQIRSFVLRNNGVRPATYVITQNGTRWLSMNSTRVRVAPGDTKVIYFRLDAPASVEEGSYRVPFTIYNEETQKTYTDSVTFVLADYNLFTYIAAFRCQIIILFLVVICLALAAYALTQRNKKASIALVLGLMVLLAVCFLCFGSIRAATGYRDVIDPNGNICETYYNEDTCQSPYYISWWEDTSRLVDLPFNDPDGNWLNYTAAEMPNISVSFSGDVALLRPDHNWYGIAETKFTADDGNGGASESPTYYLHVMNSREPSLNDLFLDYYYIFFLAGLILLIIVLLLLWR